MYVCVFMFKTRFNFIMQNAFMAQVLLVPRFRVRLRCARPGALSSALEPSATQRTSVVVPAIGVARLSSEAWAPQ